MPDMRRFFIEVPRYDDPGGSHPGRSGRAGLEGLEPPEPATGSEGGTTPLRIEPPVGPPERPGTGAKPSTYNTKVQIKKAELESKLLPLTVLAGLSLPDPAQFGTEQDSTRLIGRGRRNREVSDLLRALMSFADDNEPIDVAWYNNRGCAYAWAGNFPAAQKDFNKAAAGGLPDEAGGRQVALDNMKTLNAAWPLWESWYEMAYGEKP